MGETPLTRESDDFTTDFTANEEIDIKDEQPCIGAFDSTVNLANSSDTKDEASDARHLDPPVDPLSVDGIAPPEELSDRWCSSVELSPHALGNSVPVVPVSLEDASSDRKAKDGHAWNFLQCNICEKTFQQKLSFVNHMSIHANEYPLSCRVCRKRFKAKESLEAHTNVHLAERFYCTICNIRFENEAIFERHKVDHKPFVCTACQEAFSDQRDLLDHHATHATPVLLKCGSCDRLFFPKERQRSDSLSEQLIRCDECCDQLRSEEVFKSSVATYAGTPRSTKYRCYYCHEQFRYKYAYNSHLLTHRTPGSPGKGGSGIRAIGSRNEAAELFSCATYPDDHSLVEHRAESFVCDFCGKRFKRKEHIACHMITHMFGDRPFCCDVCHTRYKKRDTFEKHLLSHSQEQFIECNVCLEKFRVQDDYRRHMFGHANLMPFACDVCLQRFSEEDGLLQHALVHAGERENDGDGRSSARGEEESIRVDDSNDEASSLENRTATREAQESFSHATHSNGRAEIHAEAESLPPDDASNRDASSNDNLLCKFCGIHFNEVLSFENHILRHYTLKPFSCVTCAEKFADSHSLTEHQAMHSGLGKLRCDYCGKLFIQKEHLESHMIVHTSYVNRPFFCEICRRNYKTRESLDSHVLSHSERPFQCKICFEKFANVDAYHGHVKQHTEVAPYKCSVCTKRFTQKSTMLRHKHQHKKGKQFRCSVCQKGYDQLSILRAHERVHKAAKNKFYQCDFCGKRYSYERCLLDHMLVHNEGKRFDCTYCHKVYYSKASFLRHSLQHTQTKPFHCGICQAEYDCKDDFMKHFLTHKGK